MPAYRSAAEAEVRGAVVERLRKIRPTARIIHEINVSGFGNRIDVLAVDRAEIIAVEVKSAKDKLDRLKDQIAAMEGCSHHAIAVLHEKFLVETETNASAAEYERDGQFFYGKHPDHAPFGRTWIYPERSRGCYNEGAWRHPETAIQKPLPAGAINMLWREELHEMCGKFGVSAGKRPVMETMINALRWQLSGRDITLGICAALRARTCIEADPPILPKEPPDDPR